MRNWPPISLTNTLALCRSFVINQCRNPNGSSGFSSASRENKNRYFTTQSYDATTTQSDLIYTDGAHGLSEIAPTECQNLQAFHLGGYPSGLPRYRDKALSWSIRLRCANAIYNSYGK